MTSGPAALAEDKFTGLDVISLFFPPGADGVAIIVGHPVRHRESQWFRDFQRLLGGIYRARNDADTFFPERFTAFFEACKQASTVGSPVTAVEEDNRQRGFEVAGK